MNMPVKHFTFLFMAFLFAHFKLAAQTDSFDVFTYRPPEFFIRSTLPSRVQFNLTNSDTSFCNITIYKSQPAKADVMKDVISQWYEDVLKRLNKADKKPGRIFTQQMWDGWVSTVAVGNFYQHKKKCVVMLNSYKKNTTSACVVFEMSDNTFKGVVDNFSKNLHLNKQ